MSNQIQNENKEYFHDFNSDDYVNESYIKHVKIDYPIDYIDNVNNLNNSKQELFNDFETDDIYQFNSHTSEIFAVDSEDDGNYDDIETSEIYKNTAIIQLGSDHSVIVPLETEQSNIIDDSDDDMPGLVTDDSDDNTQPFEMAVITDDIQSVNTNELQEISYIDDTLLINISNSDKIEINNNLPKIKLMTGSDKLVFRNLYNNLSELKPVISDYDDLPELIPDNNDINTIKNYETLSYETLSREIIVTSGINDDTLITLHERDKKRKISDLIKPEPTRLTMLLSKDNCQFCINPKGDVYCNHITYHYGFITCKDCINKGKEALDEWLTNNNSFGRVSHLKNKIIKIKRKEINPETGTNIEDGWELHGPFIINIKNVEYILCVNNKYNIEKICSLDSILELN